MIVVKRTNSNNSDFITLIRQLDELLARVFGTKMEYYDQYNVVNNIDTVVVAYENDIPAGCGCFRQFDADTVEVKRMYVPEIHRKKGIATSVLLEREGWARELGCKNIVLETGTLLAAANGFYQKHNYKVTEKWGQYIGVETSVCMKKTME